MDGLHRRNLRIPLVGPNGRRATLVTGWLHPHEEWLLTIARGVKSRFFTMDVVRLQSGGWVVVELGDAQVAGLPDHADAFAFVRALVDQVAELEPDRGPHPAA
ncbi:MAG: ATP-grasp domain-containing protein [Planctomycetota bacterium]